MKKNYIITAIITLGLSIVFCFIIGFKIPQKDKHKDWVLLPKNKDANFEIEKTKIKVDSKIIQIPDFDGYIILNNYEESAAGEEDESRNKNDNFSVIAIDKNGKLLKVFPRSNSLKVDSINSRLILDDAITYDDDLIQYYAYDLKKFEKTKLAPVKDHLMLETFKEFLKRKNIKEPEYYEKDSIIETYKQDYLSDKQEEKKFYETLFSVSDFYKNSDDVYVNLYTDKSGQLYNIEYGKNDRLMNNVMDSLPFYFENYNKPIADKSPFFNFKESDTPTVYSNFLSTGLLEMEFRQWYRNYYSIKFGKKSFNFKDKEDDDISNTFIKPPKDENDVALIVSDEMLYRIYLKKEK